MEVSHRAEALQGRCQKVAHHSVGELPRAGGALGSARLAEMRCFHAEGSPRLCTGGRPGHGRGDKPNRKCSVDFPPTQKPPAPRVTGAHTRSHTAGRFSLEERSHACTIRAPDCIAPHVKLETLATLALVLVRSLRSYTQDPITVAWRRSLLSTMRLGHSLLSSSSLQAGPAGGSEPPTESLDASGWALRLGVRSSPKPEVPVP
jgi:hypothetical protein